MANEKKIVIIDDDTDLLSLLTFSFESDGYVVEGIQNGKDALKYIMDEEKMKSVCLLILDRLLPDIEGIQILKQLVDKYPKHCPVLILSVLSSEKDILAGLKQGAVDYVSKPFSLSILLQKAQSLIARNN